MSNVTALALIIPDTVAWLKVHARIQRRGGEGVRTPSEKRFLSNCIQDPLKIHKAIKSTFNVGLSSARQRNAI